MERILKKKLPEEHFAHYENDDSNLSPTRRVFQDERIHNKWPNRGEIPRTSPNLRTNGAWSLGPSYVLTLKKRAEDVVQRSLFELNSYRKTYHIGLLNIYRQVLRRARSFLMSFGSFRPFDGKKIAAIICARIIRILI